MPDDYLSLLGPIEREDDTLVVRSPLDGGGEQISLVARGISAVDGDDLVSTIPHWLAQKIDVSKGTEVYVDDRNGKLNITKAEVD
jgi:hypothetical protein